MVKDSGIPIITGGEDDMRKTVPFVLGVWLHLEVRKAVDDVKRNDATVISANTLRSTDFHRAIINFIAMCLELTSRMDGALNAMISALTK